jgi:subtilisin family serine protease
MDYPYQSNEQVPWGIDRIGAPAVYAANIRGTTVKVAVLDTGISIDPITGAHHPDLAANYAGGKDYIDKDNIPNDRNGHGTHISGIVAAADNGAGIVGTVPQIMLYAIKFMTAAGGYTSDELTGLEWAVGNGIKVVNMSWGSPTYSQTEHDAMDAAYDAGLLLVAAAGNYNDTLPLYPAAHDSVIAVAATDSNNNRAAFSSYYPDVELAAPGVYIYSTMPTYQVYMNSDGLEWNYDELHGTSMATPHVVGAAALVWAQNPTLTNVQVRAQLTSTASDLGAAGRDPQFGFGLVNAEAACFPPPPPNQQGTISGTVYLSGSRVSKATVTLCDQYGALKGTTTTNKSGFYSFTGTLADTSDLTWYTVRAQSGRKSATSAWTDLMPGSVTLNLYLR